MPLTRSIKPWTAAILAFLTTSVGSLSLVYVLEQQQLGEARSLLLDMAGDHAQAIQRNLERAVAANYALAALVQEAEGHVANFEAMGDKMLEFFPGSALMALAPNGVVEQFVPQEGNEKAKGFNSLQNADRREKAEAARRSGKLSLAGPQELVVGGTGLVSRLPVFLNSSPESDHFWGFTVVVIRLESVLSQSRLPLLEERGYAYKLWRVDAKEKSRVLVASSDSRQLDHPVERSFEVLDGTWILDASPRGGWRHPLSLALRLAVALIVSGLMAYLVWLVRQLREHEQGLEAQVKARTAEIESTQHQLQATLNAIPDPLFVMGLDGEYLSVQSPRPELLAAPAEVLLGKRVHDVLDKEATKVVMEALEEAHCTGWSSGRMFQLRTQGQNLWFELSVARMVVSEGERPRLIMLSRDITRRRRDETMLQLTARVFEQSSEAFAITDADGRVLMVNQAFCDISGYSREDAIGKPGKILAAHKPEDSYHRMVMEAVQTRGHWQGEAWNLRKDHSRYLQWLSLSRVDSPTGGTLHYIGSFRDITLQKETEERIRHLAYFDPLTGLPNRTLLTERSNMALGNARRNNTGLAMIFLDMDHFKNVNDSLGHGVGDQLLMDFSRRLRSRLSEQDTVSRLGGDEFLLVVNDLDAAGALELAHSVLALATHPFQIDPYELSVTLSVGVALFPDHGNDFETLYQRADAAMYRAKQGGRNQVCMFTADIQNAAARALQLENALRRALERDQLQLHYQPQIDLNSGRVIGAEALLRWRHPELGAISPGEFIPIAEDTGLIVPVGEWVLRTAVRQMRQWIDAGLPALSISVNLSPVQFRQSHLSELIQRILEESQLPPHLLELELTEGAAMDDPLGAMAIMERLHQQGIKLLIDDFGTGYSSLSHLKRFQVYKLKIDQSFVRDITEDPDDKAIVSAIISMSQALGMLTIAEGVETQGQLDFLRDQGCNEIQGYYFSRPLAAPEFEIYLRSASGAEPDICF
jgi:diguanylate cyclase (GGDEF)-like protein/PAS domain S-box-containing protein